MKTNNIKLTVICFMVQLFVMLFWTRVDNKPAVNHFLILLILETGCFVALIDYMIVVYSFIKSDKTYPPVLLAI